jgi:hypothetical protein
MTVKQIGGKNVVCPENQLERDILQRLMVHMKPETIGEYWVVKFNKFDPLDAEDSQGRIYVSWRNVSDELQFDPFCFCIDGPHLTVVKAPMPGEK